MSKFNLGDEIYVSPLIYNHIRKGRNFFSIDDHKWENIIGKTFVVIEILGEKYYNGFTSNCAIRFESGEKVFCFPEEMFERVHANIFPNEEVFIL